ncbi:unnamed protein product [Vitrella brassicaformis CCMP3155]|uniref:TIMELESS-interacting protein n=2 Tax=Vitrella brassicaformis TaxID=1169539 RepID=A0A0G4F3E8_VITBC|nr:unnamed protein product [Vitrella brassicaformis CCMP3155]|eukprot:CEM06447.1 unnamed protein product [Vitrella brassicaformis CCMP3155]
MSRSRGRPVEFDEEENILFGDGEDDPPAEDDQFMEDQDVPMDQGDDVYAADHQMGDAEAAAAAAETADERLIREEKEEREREEQLAKMQREADLARIKKRPDLVDLLRSERGFKSLYDHAKSPAFQSQLRHEKPRSGQPKGLNEQHNLDVFLSTVQTWMQQLYPFPLHPDDLAKKLERLSRGSFKGNPLRDHIMHLRAHHKFPDCPIPFTKTHLTLQQAIERLNLGDGGAKREAEDTKMHDAAADYPDPHDDGVFGGHHDDDDDHFVPDELLFGSGGGDAGPSRHSPPPPAAAGAATAPMDEATKARIAAAKERALEKKRKKEEERKRQEQADHQGRQEGGGGEGAGDRDVAMERDGGGEDRGGVPQLSPEELAARLERNRKAAEERKRLKQLQRQQEQADKANPN